MPRNNPKGRSGEKPQLIYDGDTRSSFPNSTYGQNFDFSTFPLLCEWTYKKISNEMNTLSLMPYCVFLHAMTEYLNECLLRKGNLMWGDDSILYRHNNIPTPIFEYIDGIGKVKTAAGLDVDFNLPVGGTPQGPLDANGDEAAMESGSFGSCTAETHNSYECYVSPYITRKLIERTLSANTTSEPDRFGDWSPLPPGRYPKNGIANRNLLGYYCPEKLNADGIAALRKIKFCNSDTFLGQICHSSEVLDMVSTAISSLSHKFVLSTTRLDMETSRVRKNSAAFIYLEYSKQILPRDRLAEYVDILASPESFDESTANKAYYFGYKRKRNSESVGPCYTVDDKVPEGWKETRNNNFDMIGSFASRPNQKDKVRLRDNDHIIRIMDGTTRGHDISCWINSHINKLKNY